jgi:LytS/YehU family sensor histidine kinase
MVSGFSNGLWMALLFNLTQIGVELNPVAPVVDSLQQNASTDLSSILDKQDDQIQRTLLFALIPVVVAFSFIVFIFYRSKREAYYKQKEAELKLNIAEVEMKALRSQMNPHFIFNCLNSIHHYMHRSQGSMAGEYLIKFSQLIRHVLETSSYRMIPLADDLNALKLYMELEQLRTNHSFDFHIEVDSKIDAEKIEIPPLLIQPFVENSIWHGLNHRGKGGEIKISIVLNNDMLSCRIEDNGHEGGSKEVYDLSNAVKKTSLGMVLIHDRLEVVNHLYNVKAGFTLTDLVNDRNEKEGKRVVLTLPYED